MLGYHGLATWISCSTAPPFLPVDYIAVARTLDGALHVSGIAGGNVGLWEARRGKGGREREGERGREKRRGEGETEGGREGERRKGETEVETGGGREREGGRNR